MVYEGCSVAKLWVVESLVFTSHALRQMFTRRVSAEEVRAVVEKGEPIIEYPDEQPYPCRLMLGIVGGRPLHVVLAYDSSDRKGYIVTVYEPDASRWNPDMRTRRRP